MLKQAETITHLVLENTRLCILVYMKSQFTELVCRIICLKNPELFKSQIKNAVIIYFTSC
jgi:hypothetical protein